MYFGCYGNFKFPLTFNGKNENWHLLLSHCRFLFFFWKGGGGEGVSKMLIGRLPNINFLFIGCHGKRKTKRSRNILKSQHLRNYKGDKVETFQKYS